MNYFSRRTTEEMRTEIFSCNAASDCCYLSVLSYRAPIVNDRLLARSVDNKFVNYLQHVHNDPVRCSLWVAVWLLYALFCFIECGFNH